MMFKVPRSLVICWKVWSDLVEYGYKDILCFFWNRSEICFWKESTWHSILFFSPGILYLLLRIASYPRRYAVCWNSRLDILFSMAVLSTGYLPTDERKFLLKCAFSVKHFHLYLLVDFIVVLVRYLIFIRYISFSYVLI